MNKVDLSTKSLYRINKPRQILFDREGNFLPHDKSSLKENGKTVPLVDLSEIEVIVDFFYNVHWTRSDVPYFVLLVFQREKLQSLSNEPNPYLKKHGEYFAIAN